MSTVRSHQERLLEHHTLGVLTLMAEEVEITSRFIDYENFFGITRSELNTLVKGISLFHDLGKASSYFQKHLSGMKVDNGLSQHAVIGSIALGHYLDGKIPDELGATILVAMTVVKHHHGKARPLESLIESFDDNQGEIEKIIGTLNNAYLDWMEKSIGERVNLDMPSLVPKIIKWKRNYRKFREKAGIRNYVLFEYLFSLLTWADRVDAAFNDNYNHERQHISPNIVDIFRTSEGFDEPNTDIDLLRNAFYEEAISNLEFTVGSIKGRTGIGKTLATLSLALKKRERTQKEKGYIPRILYCLPFLSIIDQTYETISKVLKTSGIIETSDILMQQHHLTDLSYSKQINEGETEDYDTYLADILLNSWDSEIVITTFVSIFHSMLTEKRNTRFFRLPGSIIILDEIQAVPPKYWKVISEILEHLAKWGGTKIIFSSATIPQPFFVSSLPLVRREYSLDRYDVKYLGKMSMEEFKYSILEEAVSAAINKKKALMVVANTINCCKELYEHLKDSGNISDEKIHCLSSNLPPAVRKNVIKNIKRKKGFQVLVTTQLIEAGVDISFDYCIRDLGPLDSILQVAGRVNRSCEKKRGELLIVDLVKEDSGRSFSWIYNSTIIWATRDILSNLGASVDEPKIYELGDKYFTQLVNKGLENESLELLEALVNLDFDKISDFSLIEQIKGSVTIPVFLEINNDAKHFWKTYCEVLSEIPPKENKYQYLARKKQAIRNLAPYVVNLRVFYYPGAKTYALPDIQHGFSYVSSDDLKYYYDPKTGLKSDDGSLFL